MNYSDSNDSMAKLLNTYSLASFFNGKVEEFTWTSGDETTHELEWIEIPTVEYKEENQETHIMETRTEDKYKYGSTEHYKDSKIDEQLATIKSKFKPLNDNEKKTNHFYIGSYDAGNMPHMTLDDFRIANEAHSTIDHKDYFPSRFPKPQTIHGIPCAGVFQGKMASKKTGTITSFSWTNRTDGTIKPGYSLYVIKNEELASSSATEDYTDYNELFKNFWAGVYRPFSLQDLYRKNFNSSLSYDQYNSSEYTNWTPKIVITKIEVTYPEYNHKHGWRLKTETTYEKRMYLDVTYNGQKYSLAKTYNANTITQEEKKDSNYTEKFHPFEGCKISEYQCYPTNSSSSYSKIEYLLNDWAKNYATEYKYLVEKQDDSSKTEKELADIEFKKSIDTTVSVTPLDAHNKPYIFDDKNKTFVYEIMFPASSKEDSSIFNGPAVDDVTLIYMLDQAKLIEYYSEKIQPRL